MLGEELAEEEEKGEEEYLLGQVQISVQFADRRGTGKENGPEGRGGESRLRPEQVQIATRLLILDGGSDQ